MLIRPRILGEHRPWLIGVLLFAALAVGWCAAQRWQLGYWPRGSSLTGMVLGISGGGIIIFECLLWPRKKFRRFRLVRASSWLRAHIWLGLLSVPLIVLHSGWRWGGQLSMSLMILFLLVIVSGIAGLALQQFIPRLLLDAVPAETIYSQIDFVAQQYCHSAEDLVVATCGPDPADRRLQRDEPPGDRETSEHLVVGAVRQVGNVRGKTLQSRFQTVRLENPELLLDAFYTNIAPYLLQGKRSGSILGSANQARRLFESLKNQLDPAAGPVVDSLESLCEQRHQFDIQQRLHFWLQSWLWIHLPLSIALVALMFLHIFAALKYL